MRSKLCGLGRVSKVRVHVSRCTKLDTDPRAVSCVKILLVFYSEGLVFFGLPGRRVSRKCGDHQETLTGDRI